VCFESKSVVVLCVLLSNVNLWFPISLVAINSEEFEALLIIVEVFPPFGLVHCLDQCFCNYVSRAVAWCVTRILTVHEACELFQACHLQLMKFARRVRTVHSNHNSPVKYMYDRF